MPVDGEHVSVHYTGSLDDGSIFDSSDGRDPLDFVIGGGSIIPGFEDAVRGLAVGDSTIVRIEPMNAYGVRRDDLVVEIPSEFVPEDLHVGAGVELEGGVRGVVSEILDGSVTVDANHPLAGKTLTFAIELVAVR